MEKISAVIVTYNRKRLLQECLNAVLGQTYPVDKIFIIDNASTDGTNQMLKELGYLKNPQISYFLLTHNTGGSGGFYYGMHKAMRDTDGWIWLMDDDTIPAQNCLEELMKAKQILTKESSTKLISYLASTVYGSDGGCMNVPVIDNRLSKNGYASWYEFLNSGIIKLESSTFVSILINKDAVLKCGYPCRDFFIWGDDTEYTTRLSTFYGEAYFIGKSVAIHKRIGMGNISLGDETDPQQIDKHYYHCRNILIYRHYYGINYYGAVIEMIKVFIKAANYINHRPYAWKKAYILIKGNLAGIMQYKKFKSYIDKEISEN